MPNKNLAAARAKSAAKLKTKKLSASSIKVYRHRIRKAEAAAAEGAAAEAADPGEAVASQCEEVRSTQSHGVARGGGRSVSQL